MEVTQANHIPPKCPKPVKGSVLILELGGARVRSVVVIVNVAVVVALGVTVLGEIEQPMVVVAGATLQVSATGWIGEPTEEMASV
jgi:hypothetical protein